MASVHRATWSTRKECFNPMRPVADSGTAPAMLAVAASRAGDVPSLALTVTDDTSTARKNAGDGSRYRVELSGAEVQRVAFMLLSCDLLARPMGYAAKLAANARETERRNRTVAPRHLNPANMPAEGCPDVAGVILAARDVLAAWKSGSSIATDDAMTALRAAMGED